MKLKFFIKTYGCQMNERDSDAAAAMLIKQGFLLAQNENEADILIFNTCAVRDQAERKAIGKIGLTCRLKRQNPSLLVGAMGCMAQSRGDALLKAIPHLDFVIGTDQLHCLPQIIQSTLKSRKRSVSTTLGDPQILTAMSDHLDLISQTSRISDSVAISRGCSRFCAYCIVPYVRGPEKSRNPQDIVQEVRQLTQNGIKEILLLGQNVCAFGLDNQKPPPPDHLSPFADLLEQLHEIKELLRIRFTSPHPAYFNHRLIQAIAALPKVCHHIHLPLQSGSSNILKKMNRPYSQAHYLNLVKTIREAIPDIAFSTDVIVGFPGETEDDFNETRKVFHEVQFDNAYIFKYSPRTGTPAAVMENQIATEIKEERNQILLQDLAESSRFRNQSLVGQTVEVLAEGPSKRNIERWAGRTGGNKIVIFTPPQNINSGDLLRVKIERTTTLSLFGTPV